MCCPQRFEKRHVVVRVVPSAQQRDAVGQLLSRPDAQILRPFPVVAATAPVCAVREFSVHVPVAHRSAECAARHGSQVGTRCIATIEASVAHFSARNTE